MADMGYYDFFNYQQDPNSYYRELTQSFVDDAWENTSAKTPGNEGAILEQADIGSDDYSCIEAWVKPTVAETSTGMKNPGDFLQFIFRCIGRRIPRGLMYQYADDYWIVHAENTYDGLYSSVGVRRCNNYLRITDPESGEVYTQPCVVDYDMASPALQVSTYINTPNNHAVVVTQGNETAYRLFKYNTRYILGGRPFKLYSYQNAINVATERKPTYLMFDLYLDEAHAGDDIENQLADNSSIDYPMDENEPFPIN